MTVKCDWNWKGTGHQVFYDLVSHEMLAGSFPVQFADDFLGAHLQKYTSGENTTSPWQTVETNLNTAIGLVTDEVNGVVQLTLDSDDNAEVACLHFGDNECLSIAQGLIFETRLTFHVLPTTGTETVQAVFGVAGQHNTTPDSVDVHAWFRVESAAQTALLWETDDNTTNDDDNAAGVTLVADTYHVFRIDCTSVSAVKFYVDDVLVGTADMSDLTTALAKVQPYFCLSKAKSVANTGTGTLYIDYVKAWQNRSE